MNEIPKPALEDAKNTLDVVATVKNSSSSAKSSKKLSRSRFMGSFNLIHGVLIALAMLLLVQWWSSTSQISQLREELARRLQSTDMNNAETKAIAKSVLETDKELQVKLGVLETKQAESESHALALQQLYQDLSKNRDDWALSEIEQVLSTASQQLQLAGNVQGALIALQNADARLARSDKPQFISIRRSIAHDIDRLKALPNVDLPGIALRIDSAIAQVDNMPLLTDEKPVAIANPTKVNEAGRVSSKSTRNANSPKAKDAVPADTDIADNASTSNWRRWLNEHWQSWSVAMEEEMRQLVRIRNVENPDALMLAPDQAYFVRENIKLRLLNARLALLSRNEPAFKSDLMQVQKEIGHYFDTRAKQTQAVQALLRQIQNSKVSIEMPSLAESINAVRNFTVKQ